MLNFRNTLVFFSVLLSAVLITDFFVPVGNWLYIGIALALIALLTWGSVSIQHNFYLHSLCSGSRHEKAVALTFDDGPDAQVTPMILDMLKEHHVKATFFVVGSKAQKHPEILKRITAEGHILGGHSYSHHFFFDLFSGKRMRNEMKHTSDVVFSITGKRLCLFRPPYGVTNPTIARAIKAMNYLSVGWSLKSKDTSVQDESVILNRLIANVKRGDIILFHDNKTWLVKLVSTFIHYLKEKEYAIEPLDNLLTINAYAN